MTHSDIEAIVLAAGLSSRFPNYNKMLLPLGEHTVLTTTLKAILRTDLTRIIVVTGYDNDRVQQAIPLDERITTVINEAYEKGMMSSIQTGIRALSPDAKGFMVCLGDMPLLSPHHYSTLIDLFLDKFSSDPKAIVKPFISNQPGQPTLFSRAYVDDFLQSDLKKGGQQLVQMHAHHLTTFITIDDSFLIDVDTPENYERVKDKFEKRFM